MKQKAFLIVALVGWTFLINAQDTLFYENFNSWQFEEIDSVFTTYDEDLIPDYNGLPGNWFVANFANSGADSSEIVALSSSWLIGFAPGNRNHLQLPGINVTDTNAVLSWRSAPALGDLYMDGYTVVIYSDSLCFYSVVGCNHDTLMHFAQNINDNATQFSTGIIHTSLDLNVPINIASSTQYPGLLQNWQVSLKDYAGQKVFINFLHNSDDDNFIAIDDILVTGTNPATAMEEFNMKSSFNIYPNPSSSKINIDLRLIKSSILDISIYNSLGLKILNIIDKQTIKPSIDISSMSSGLYFINILTEDGIITNQFVKK